MNKLFSDIKQNTYILQIMTLMSGTLIAQVISLAFIPVITRLYTPAEFGLYSLFFSIVSILGLVSSWKYDQAIMLPKDDEDANALVFLSILITLGMVFVVSIGIILFNFYIVDYFDDQKYLVWLIPLGVLLIGLLQIFNAYSSRNQYYKKLATVRVANSTTVSSVQAASKYILKFNGLVLGKLLADILSLFLLLKFNIKKQTLHFKYISRKRLIVNSKRYDHFPKYQSLTVFLNSISQNIPILLFASLYSPEIAGFYALTVRVLKLPVSLIGSSTGEVYYQKASKMYSSGENIFNLYKNTTLSLLKIFIVPFFVVLFAGEHLFRLVFGSEWTVSGYMAQILILWFLFSFITPPSFINFRILNLQKVQMKLEIISVSLRFLSIYAGFFFYDSFIISIILFLISSVSINIIAMIFIYFYLKKI